jgi:hypothetical protein
VAPGSARPGVGSGRAADENEIKARLAEDPWASAGLLRIAAIEPWALWLDSRPEN